MARAEPVGGDVAVAAEGGENMEANRTGATTDAGRTAVSAAVGSLEGGNSDTSTNIDAAQLLPPHL